MASTSDAAAVASEQAKQLGTTAADTAGQLVGVAKEEAGDVANEVVTQARSVLDQALGRTKSRAQEETQGVAQGLRRWADQGQALVEGRPAEAGAVGDYLGQGVARLRGWADQLERRGPEGVVSDVAGFARRQPTAFLAGAVVAGLVVGRLARSGAFSRPTTADSGALDQADRSSDGAPPALAGPGASLPRGLAAGAGASVDAPPPGAGIDQTSSGPGAGPKDDDLPWPFPAGQADEAESSGTDLHG